MQCDILDWILKKQQEDLNGKTGNLNEVWILDNFTNVDIGVGWVQSVWELSVLYLQLFCELKIIPK